MWELGEVGRVVDSRGSTVVDPTGLESRSGSSVGRSRTRRGVGEGQTQCDQGVSDTARERVMVGVTYLVKRKKAVVENRNRKWTLSGSLECEKVVVELQERGPPR